jgi:predicted nuclease of predicted toxin-antitoxin system
MRFLIDECMGRKVYDLIKQNNHDVVLIEGNNSGVSDNLILQKAVSENRVIITCDKDFGDMIFRDKKQHTGIILLRLQNEKIQNKINVINILLKNYSENIKNNFIIISEKKIRIIEQ